MFKLRPYQANAILVKKKEILIGYNKLERVNNHYCEDVTDKVHIESKDSSKVYLQLGSHASVPLKNKVGDPASQLKTMELKTPSVLNNVDLKHVQHAHIIQAPVSAIRTAVTDFSNDVFDNISSNRTNFELYWSLWAIAAGILDKPSIEWKMGFGLYQNNSPIQVKAEVIEYILTNKKEIYSGNNQEMLNELHTNCNLLEKKFYIILKNQKYLFNHQINFTDLIKNKNPTNIENNTNSDSEC